MTGKDVAAFLWWVIYAVALCVCVFHIFHVQIVVILWMFALSLVYSIGAAFIKEAK